MLLAAEVYELVHQGQKTYRETAELLELSGTSVVSRLLHEHVKVGMTAELRDQELANLDAWHERLTEAAELCLQLGEKPEGMAPLAVAATKISESRRKILAIDLPATVNIRHGQEKETAPPPTWISRAIAESRGKLDEAEALEERGRPS